MRQSFRLIVQLSNHVCTIQADKFSTVLSIVYVVCIDNPDLLDKTGVRQAVFHFDTCDKDYLNPTISYRQRRPDLPLPNFSFEQVIAESIRRHEGVSKTIPRSGTVEKATIL